MASFFNWTNITAPTLGGSQTLIAGTQAASGGYFWSQRMSATTSTAGTLVTINDTAPTAIDWAGVIVEVMAPAIGGVSSGYMILQ